MKSDTVKLVHGALDHEDQTHMKHENQGEAVENVRKAGGPQNVEDDVYSRWDYNSSLIGELGETQSEGSVVCVAAKLPHGSSQGKHHHDKWHVL